MAQDINDCCRRNNQLRNMTIRTSVCIKKFNILRKFVGDAKPSIDLGCGAYEPLEINTTDACDIAPAAAGFLKEHGFKGNFFVADIRNLPTEDKKYKVAVCSEVIEHLKTEEDVIKAFKEIDRISESWIVTTPLNRIPDPDHYFFFTRESLKKLIPLKDYFIFDDGFYIYISNKKEVL